MKETEKIIANMETIIIGKRAFLERLVVALLTNGHVLIEDVPGIGKTQCVGALARSVNGKFNRVQFTPDLMASDITGFYMLNQKNNEFEFREGAANCNFLLADEINRASSKTQSSLLEVMEEKQITVDGTTFKVPLPFMVLATQNPVESKGTNSLPEAQMDRFLFKLSIGYPNKAEEKAILDRFEGENPLHELRAICSVQEILKLQREVLEVNASEEVRDYIINLINYTRNTEDLTLGASPRASLALLKASKGFAYLRGRDYVLPEDVKEVAKDVLAHRLIVSSTGKVNGLTQRSVVEKALNTVKINGNWKS